MAGSGFPKEASFTFRLEPNLKAALTDSAAEQHKLPGELMRELARTHVAQRQHRAFEEEARRQCAIVNDAAQDPAGNEAQVMRELDAYLLEVGDEWT